MDDKHPFEIVDRAERRTPLQELNARDCMHTHVFTSDSYPASGTRYICVDCGFGSGYPRDLR
jgi:hypothetical protein